MSAPAFTSGPWEYRELKNGWGVFPASVSRKGWRDDQAICGGEADYDPLWLKEPEEANARLIAAAPELYEALIAARRVMYDGHAISNQIDAALAKARGEQS